MVVMFVVLMSVNIRLVFFCFAEGSCPGSVESSSGRYGQKGCWSFSKSGEDSE